jgi:hypothetical protein
MTPAEIAAFRRGAEKMREAIDKAMCKRWHEIAVPFHMKDAEAYGVEKGVGEMLNAARDTLIPDPGE